MFEWDLEFYIINFEFIVLESKFSNNEINVKEFIEGLGIFEFYMKEFYVFYFNIKVIEMGIKYFFGWVFFN